MLMHSKRFIWIIFRWFKITSSQNINEFIYDINTLLNSNKIKKINVSLETKYIF